jgi:SpoVK/Ycf46/Vps4 family AAA+-type ATPase
MPNMLSTIERQKARVVANVPGLLYYPRDQIEKSEYLPGYEALHDFLRDCMDIPEDLALKHNLRPLRGFLVVGIPGTGKTVTMLQSARMLGKSLFIWSPGESLGMYVGQGEERTRMVLDILDANNAVCGLDDLDKAGANTSQGFQGDGGVFSRMMNMVLTKMSDPASKITWIMTANRVQALPPELIRQGRLDERFRVDLPNAATRANILRYHIARLNFPTDQFVELLVSSKGTSEAVMDIANNTKNWTGSELEGLVTAYARKALRARSDVLDIKAMARRLKDPKRKIVPLVDQEAFKEDMASMQNLAKNFTPIGNLEDRKVYAAERADIDIEV